MIFNSKQFVATAFTFVLSFLIAGCWAPSKDKDSNKSAASFYVKDAKGEFLPADPSLDLASTVWKTISAQNYKFRVCLSDHYANQPVKESTFKVITDDDAVYPTITDAQGCLEWTERFPFNYFAAQSVYVLVNRTIKPDAVDGNKAGHKGSATLQFAINPWQPYRDPGVPSVVYLSGNKAVVPQGQLVTGDKAKTALSGGENNFGSLWMKDLKLHHFKMNTGSIGYNVDVQYEMTPTVILKNLSGENKQIPVPGGRFKLQSYLLATDYAVGEKPLILNPQSPASVGEVFGVDGILRFKINVPIERRVASGQLLLAIKVIPLDGPNLKHYQTLQQLGDFSDLVKGSVAPILRPEIWDPQNQNAFVFDNFISAENTANFSALQAAKTASQLNPYEFETAQVRFEKIAPGETSTTRTVEYRVTTCVIDNISLRRVGPGHKFAVSFENKGFTETFETDASGCLRLIGEITHKYYESQSVIFQNFDLRKVDTCSGPYNNLNSRCFDFKLTVGVNPYDRITFGRDAREWTAEYIKKAASIKSSPSRFVIDRYSYNTLGFRYEVDEFLSMKVIKRIYLRVEPMVLLHHSLTQGRNYNEPLRDGLYLLKVAMHRDYLDTTSKSVHISNRSMEVKDPVTGRPVTVTKSMVEANPDQRPRTFVSVVKKVVRVQRGVIVTPIELRLRDLRLMSVRANLLVQIAPIDERLLQQAIAVERNLEGMSSNEITYVKEMIEQLDAQREEDKELGVDNSFGEVNEEQAELRESLKSQTLNKMSAMFAKMQMGTSQLPDPNFGTLNLDWFVKNKILTPEEKQKIEHNDFSESSLVSKFDYNLFIDKNSGLESRTFVGPIRLLENVAQNAMVPTDSMNDLFCNGADCNQLEELESNRGKSNNASYENIKFFGSIQHLHGVSVDDMIDEKVSIETNYYREQYLGSLVSSFADTFNLKFVSLNDEQALVFQDKCDIQPRVELNRFESWTEWQSRVQKEFASCMVKGTDIQIQKDDFLNKLNGDRGWFDSSSPIEAKDIEQLIKAGKVLPRLGERLCKLWSKEFYKKSIQDGPGSYRGRANSAVDIFEHTCKQSLGNGKPDSPQDSFMVDTKIRVKKVGSHQYKGGKSVNINVVSGFQLARVEGANIHGTVGFDPLGVPMIRDIISSPAKGGINLNYNIARNRTDSTNIMEQTFLVMQTAALAIELEEYEYCAVVRVNPKIKDMYAQLNKHFRPDLIEKNEFYRQRLLAQGLYICTGKNETKKIPILERYFYMTQHFTEGDMLDTAEFYNRPWLLSLRGIRDMRTFMKYVREQDQRISFDQVPAKLGQGVTDFFSINQLSQAYMRVLPSFPGVFTVIDEKQEHVAGLDYPFSSDPYQAFDKNLDRIGIGFDAKYTSPPPPTF